MARFTEKMIEHIRAGIRNIVAPADEDQAKTLAAVAEAKAMAGAFGSDQEERLSKKKKTRKELIKSRRPDNDKRTAMAAISEANNVYSHRLKEIEKLDKELERLRMEINEIRSGEKAAATGVNQQSLADIANKKRAVQQERAAQQKLKKLKNQK